MSSCFWHLVWHNSSRKWMVDSMTMILFAVPYELHVLLFGNQDQTYHIVVTFQCNPHYCLTWVLLWPSPWQPSYSPAPWAPGASRHPSEENLGWSGSAVRRKKCSHMQTPSHLHLDSPAVERDTTLNKLFLLYFVIDWNIKNVLLVLRRGLI